MYDIGVELKEYEIYEKSITCNAEEKGILHYPISPKKPYFLLKKIT